MSKELDNYFQEMKELELLTEVAIAGANFLTSRASFEIHCDDPYGDAQVEMTTDYLRYAIDEYNKVRK
jgi:hypothetical protein